MQVLLPPSTGAEHRGSNIGAQIITNTILVVPYYSHRIMGPKNHILNIKAPTLVHRRGLGSGVLGLGSDQGVGTLKFLGIVEARKLEHQYPHALKLEYGGS